MSDIRVLEDRLFAQLRASDPSIVDDGIVDVQEYLSAKHRIMYVLKEVNGGSGWSLREFLCKGGRAQTWDNIARWTEAILNLQENHPWSYWEEHCEQRRHKMLPKICAVNIKKTAGGDTSHRGEIQKAAETYHDLLQQQFKLYEPDLVICCGTEQAFVSACFNGIPIHWKMTSRGIWYFHKNDTVIISFVHPEARIKDCILHYALIDAVREIDSDFPIKHHTPPE